MKKREDSPCGVMAHHCKYEEISLVSITMNSTDMHAMPTMLACLEVLVMLNHREAKAPGDYHYKNF